MGPVAGGGARLYRGCAARARARCTAGAPSEQTTRLRLSRFWLRNSRISRWQRGRALPSATRDRRTLHRAHDCARPRRDAARDLARGGGGRGGGGRPLSPGAPAAEKRAPALGPPLHPPPPPRQQDETTPNILARKPSSRAFSAAASRIRPW